MAPLGGAPACWAGAGGPPGSCLDRAADPDRPRPGPRRCLSSAAGWEHASFCFLEACDICAHLCVRVLGAADIPTFNLIVDLSRGACVRVGMAV